MTYSVHCSVAAVRYIDIRHVDTTLLHIHLSYIVNRFYCRDVLALALICSSRKVGSSLGRLVDQVRIWRGLGG